MRSGHPLANKPLSLENLIAADHLMVSLSGNAHSQIDEILAQHNVERRIAMTVNHFSSIGALLSDSDLIAIAPSIAIEREIFSGKLAVTDAPIEIPPSSIGYFWHQRQAHDDGLKWLRKHITQVIKQHTQRHYDELCLYLNKTRAC